MQYVFIPRHELYYNSCRVSMPCHFCGKKQKYVTSQKLRTDLAYAVENEKVKGIIINVFMCEGCGNFQLVDKANTWKKYRRKTIPQVKHVPHIDKLTQDEKDFLGKNSLSAGEMKKYIQEVKQHTAEELEKNPKEDVDDNIGRIE